MLEEQSYPEIEDDYEDDQPEPLESSSRHTDRDKKTLSKDSLPRLSNNVALN